MIVAKRLFEVHVALRMGRVPHLRRYQVHLHSTDEICCAAREAGFSAVQVGPPLSETSDPTTALCIFTKGVDLSSHAT